MARGFGAAAGSKLVLVVVFSLLAVSSAQTKPALNITAILDKIPSLSVLRTLLISSGVEKEINSRTSLTLLAPPNSVLTAFQASVPNADAVKIADLLRYHVILQYYDMAELKLLPTGNFSSATTLLQTTGKTTGQDGFVNLYNTANGIVIGPTDIGSSGNTTVVGSLLQQPYDISIIQVDQVLKPPGFDAVEDDLIAILESFQEYSLFIRFLKDTGVDTIFANRQSTGVTVFAPKDSAFNALNANQSILSLSVNRQKLLLQYHALTSYYTLINLQTMSNAGVQTIASTVTGGYKMNVTSAGAVVTIRTGVSNGTITDTLYNAQPVTMYSVDTVLLPTELFGTADELAPAEAPTPLSAPPPAAKKAPAPAPKAVGPSIALPTTTPDTVGTNDNAATMAQISGALSFASLIVSSLVALY